MKYLRRVGILLIISVLIINCGCNEVKKSHNQSSSDSNDTSSEYVDFQSSEASSVVEEIPSSSQEISSVAQSRPVSKVPAPASSVVTVVPAQVPVVQQAAEMRAVWISFLEFGSILRGKSQSQFTYSIKKYFDKCVNYGLNTVIVQVRSHCDALYKSSIYPSSVYFTGIRQNYFPFDPLQIMIDEAHTRGLKIEAWVNPYRGNELNMALAENDPMKNFVGTDYVYQYCSNSSTFNILNPGEPEVRSLIINGVIEIVNNYNVDGIHLDDYFYLSSDPAIDANAYAKYGQGMDLGTFRKNCVNELISSIYREIKARKNITFGISPQGNIDNCLNAGADVRLWGSTQGFVDYLAPQLYWAFGEGTLPYETALQNWTQVVTNPSVKLIVGLAPYKVGKNPFWSTGNVLANQVTEARKVERYSGFILFRYDQFFSAQLETERLNLKGVF